MSHSANNELSSLCPSYGFAVAGSNAMTPRRPASASRRPGGLACPSAPMRQQAHVQSKSNVAPPDLELQPVNKAAVPDDLPTPKTPDTSQTTTNTTTETTKTPDALANNIKKKKRSSSYSFASGKFSRKANWSRGKKNA
jgi:hypothetical protein